VRTSPAEHRLRQHDVVADEPRNLAELERYAAHRCHAYVEHMPAVNVELVAQLGEPRVNGLGRCHGQAGDLDFDARIVVLLTAKHDHVTSLGVAHQQHGQLETGERRARSVRQVCEGWRRQPQRRQVLAGEELLQCHGRVMRRDGEAVDRDFPAGLPRPGVERRLQVHVLEHRQGTRHHRLLRCGLAQVVANQRDHLIALLAVLGVHPIEKRTKRGRELAGLGIGRTRHIHWNDIRAVREFSAIRHRWGGEWRIDRGYGVKRTVITSPSAIR
jgi:hypothetical protein